VQQTISLAKNQTFVGRTLDVLIEGRGDGLTVGRSYRDAPEVDGYVIIEGDAPTDRPIIPVQITGAMLYDLIGRFANGSQEILPLQALEKRE
jgi:ribosomal protein S12 methylthiotransferase